MAMTETFDKTFCIICNVTKLPYIACNEYSLNDQIFLYGDRSCAEEASQEHQEISRIPLSVMELQNNQLFSFLVSLYYLGVNEAVMQKNSSSAPATVAISKIIPKPDFGELPELQRKLMETENPALTLTAVYFAQKNAVPQEQKNLEELVELEDEILINLKRGSMILPLESFQSEGNKKPETRVPLMKMKNGDVYLPVCTDSSEYMKISQKNFGFCTAKLEAIKKMCGQNVKGIVLNPGTVAICIPKEKL